MKARPNPPNEVERRIAALKDRDWEVRRRAAFALADLGDARAVAPLIAALEDARPVVRSAAAVALGTFGDKRAVQPLMEALEDEDEWVSFASAGALFQIGVPNVERLLKTLIARHGRTHPAIDFVSARTGETSVSALIEILNEHPAVAKILGETGDARAIDPLLAALRNGTETVRAAAAKALGNLRPSRAVKPLIDALKDSNEEVRTAAAGSLVQIGDMRAVEPFLQVLKDESWAVRRHAVEALGKWGDEKVVEPLLETLKDDDQEVRWTAARALGQFRDVRTIEPLVRALEDITDEVAVAAAQALEQFGNARHLPRTILAETRLSPQLRGLTLNALHSLQHRYELRWNDSFPEARVCCEQSLLDEDPNVREGARAVLDWLQGERLLRPADTPTASETLLRPAQGAGETDPETLPRPVEIVPDNATKKPVKTGLFTRLFHRNQNVK